MVALSRRRAVVFGLLVVLAVGCGSAQTTSTTAPSRQAPSAASTPVAPGASATEPEPGRTIREFDVPAGSHPHDVAPATDGGIWYTGSTSASSATSIRRPAPFARSRSARDRAARRHHRTGRRAVDHRRRPERDRPRRSGDRRGHARSRSRGPAAARTSTPPSSIAAGILWFTGQSGIYGRLDPTTGDMEVFDDSGGPRPVRHHRDPERRRLVRLARRQPHRPGRPRDRRGDDRRAADAQPGRTPRLVRLAGPVWVSEWNAGQVGGPRPGDRQLAGVAAARRRPAGVRGLRRRARTSSG